MNENAVGEPASDRERVLARLAVSRETVERLEAFVTLLLKWQTTVNLVAHATLPTLWTRHILDCAQLLPLGEGRRRWLDLGSGAGFPGLVIAILGRTTLTVDLVESDRRKSAFLREAARVTGAPARVHAERVENVVPRFIDVADAMAITARALAPLPVLLGLAEPLLTRGALGIFPKGQGLESEMSEAIRGFDAGWRQVPSETDAQARIMIVRDLRRRAQTRDEDGH